METEASVSLMIMYEDESVDARFVNGVRLQLSPCGCECTLVKPPDPSGHPLQPPQRLRQRTRFTISSYKKLMVAALAFRNKYASRPYLPEELIPAEHKKPFFSIDSDVQWPEESSCQTELGPGGETVVQSEEERALLMLSPSGEDFCVEFTCCLSRTQSQYPRLQSLSKDSDSSTGCPQQQVTKETPQTYEGTQKVHQGRGSRRSESTRSRSCSPRITVTPEPKPEVMFQSTTVVQHHSCCAAPPIWRYPLYLARRLRTARLSKLGDDGDSDGRIHMSDFSKVERTSHLPQALPLTCPFPHWHRWNVTDPATRNEYPDQDLPTELVKVMWCQGVTYRILRGAVSVVEVSLGDGSVMRSNGVLSTYFTHYKPELLTGQVKEVTYHLNNLPPDIPGQLYSMHSIVSRASRILTCYNEAKQSLTLPASPSCLQEVKKCSYFSNPAVNENSLCNFVTIEQHKILSRTVESRSDIVAAELEKIKRFNFLLENSCLLRSEKSCAAPESSSAEEETHEAFDESCIAEALQRTSRAIQDINALMSAATD